MIYANADIIILKVSSSSATITLKFKQVMIMIDDDVEDGRRTKCGTM